ncbi:MaoC family dehydratase [Novispirillum sp. DQ9]|uniref:MaoC family dehydratase n=1 Tax=Novispirillum sp. DQ9 TaxID=3398612 RepID=UPI003C7A18A1
MSALDNPVTHYFEDITEGMSATFGKTVTEADILMFSGVSGDTNPVHLNDEYAKTTMFKGRIAHGMLSAGLISAVFGTKLPGPGCIYVNQSLKFKAPVKIGDTVVARVECTGKAEDKGFVTFRTQALVGDKVVIDGEATLMVPKKG